MRHISTLKWALVAAASTLAVQAHAELQTWRLTATAYKQAAEDALPDYVSLGSTITVDYTIDTQTPADTTIPGFFSGAVVNFSFHGETSDAQGYLSATGSGLNAINIWPVSMRNDTLNFLSFNLFTDKTSPDVASALNDFATATANPGGADWTDLRLDFNNGSVWAKPESFAAVPEPGTYGLMLLGLAAVAVSAKRQRRHH